MIQSFPCCHAIAQSTSLIGMFAMICIKSFHVVPVVWQRLVVLDRSTSPTNKYKPVNQQRQAVAIAIHLPVRQPQTSHLHLLLERTPSLVRAVINAMRPQTLIRLVTLGVEDRSGTHAS